MSQKNRFDEFLVSLADGYRRELLLALLEHNPQNDDDTDPLNLHQEGDADLTEMNIRMGHLPLLETVGIIEWDPESNAIVKGPDWNEFEPLLRLIDDNKEKLPDEWFEESDSG